MDDMKFIEMELMNCKSRDEAHAVLKKYCKNLKALIDLAKYLDVKTSFNSKILTERIISSTTGAKLEFNAIQGT